MPGVPLGTIQVGRRVRIVSCRHDNRHATLEGRVCSDRDAVVYVAYACNGDTCGDPPPEAPRPAFAHMHGCAATLVVELIPSSLPSVWYCAHNKRNSTEEAPDGCRWPADAVPIRRAS